MRIRPSVIGLIALVVLVLVALAVVGRLSRRNESVSAARAAAGVRCHQVASAFRHKSSGEWVTAAGSVSRTLPDSHGLSTHQRFILRCPTGQTVLIDNNVDVGRRVPLHRHERIAVHGQYIWNDLGGLIHDTHHSTDANPDGWILAGDKVYQ